MKIIVITNIPSPYRIPLFNALNDDCRSRSWKLKVIFLSRGYSRRKWQVDESAMEFDREYLSDFHVTLGEGFSSSAWSLSRVLRKEAPNAVIVGGFSLATVWTKLYCDAYHVPWAIWSGETIAEEALRTRFAAFRRMMRAWIVRGAKTFVCYGTAAREYLIGLGIADEKIFTAINTVDTTRLRDSTARARDATGSGATSPPRKTVLFIGYLERRKGVHLVLHALAQLRDRHGMVVTFHIVGSGPEEKELREFVKIQCLESVHFWGYKQQNELPAFFARADLLVFPSTNELYGLVPIEAMAAGVPVLASMRAGSTRDLIQNGENGVVFDPYDTEELAEKLFCLLKNRELLLTLARNGQETVESRFSIHNSANGFVETIEHMLNDKSKK